MKRPDDRYECDELLGKRLRECRLRAGLTQQQLAAAMGRQGKGGHHVAGRLERGEVANPGVGLLADYLRGCRASFADIQAVLDRYTARETVTEVETQEVLAEVQKSLPASIGRAMERFDQGTQRAAAGRKEEPPGPRERVQRARSFAQSQVWAVRVRRRVVDVVHGLRPFPGTGIEQHLQNYGARVWRILNRTRKQPEGRRQALLDEALKPYLLENGPSRSLLDAARQSIFDLFRQAEIAGGLDVEAEFEPGEEIPRHLYSTRLLRNKQ